MKILKSMTTMALLLSPFCGSQAAETTEVPEEIVVVGRQPGPPLWKVSNGDKVLWIFPYLSTIPKDMIWETDKVEKVIAESQEGLSLPSQDATISPLVMFNPINIFRGVRLMRRMSRNPDGATLEEVLPPELYARFSALQASYFPREDALDDMRPMVAGGRMTSLILEEEGLVDGRDILKAILRLKKRNRDMVLTEITVSVEIEGGYRDLADRAQAMMDSLSPEQELACFEQQVLHMEQDLEHMKSRANTWAQGYVDEFRNIPLVGEEEDACIELMVGTSEEEFIIDINTRMNQMWLEAAERALATNQSTFATLNINDLISENGLLSQLKAKGYEVREP